MKGRGVLRGGGREEKGGVLETGLALNLNFYSQKSKKIRGLYIN